MTDVTELLVSTATRIFDDVCTPDLVDSGWSADLWRVLEENGLTRLSVPETAGGSGGHLRDAASLLRVSGQYAAPLPLSETILASFLLAEAGIEIPDGPLTVCISPGVRFDQVKDGWQLSGIMRRVPWASVASHVIVVGQSSAGESLGILARQNYRVDNGYNIAREPRDHLLVETSLDTDHVVHLPVGTIRAAQLRGTLFRVALMTGAAERALELTLSYTSDRHQFGKAIGHFQVVQQQVAEMVGEVVALRTASDAAIEYFTLGSHDRATALVAVAAAKSQGNRAAGIVTRIAHQLHGALGFTQEHSLRLSTTRLWAWRDEWGSEMEWWSEIGMLVLTGHDGVWPTIASFE